MRTDAATLLKFRLDTFEQLRNHLHVSGSRTLVFYREPAGALAPGMRVVVEFSFAVTEQVITLRGAVVRRVDGGDHVGAWLEFGDTRLSGKLEHGAESIKRRSQRRLGCELMVDLRVGKLPVVGRMIDVSLAGAHVLGVPTLRTGVILEARLMGADRSFPVELGQAKVVRADRNGDVGLSFVRSDPVARLASTKLYSALQQAWARAPEAIHSPLCCQNGVVLEPPMPWIRPGV